MSSDTAVLPTADRAATSAILMDLARRRAWPLIQVIALFAGATAVSLVGPRLLGIVVDEVSGARDRGVIDAAAIAFLAVTVIGALMAYAAESRAAVLGEDVLHELRGTLFGRCVDLPLAVTERAGSGELLSRVIGDVSALSRAARDAVPRMLLASVELILTLGALLLLSPLFAAAVLAGLPIGIVVTRWYRRHCRPTYRESREATALVTTEMNESFAGAATISAHRLGPHRSRRIRLAGTTMFNSLMRAAVLRNGLRAGIALAQFTVLITVLAAGNWLLDQGTISLGMLTAAAFYVLRISDPVETIVEFLDDLQTASAAMDRVAGVLDLDAPAPPIPQRAPTPLAVRLRGVRFSYVAGREVLLGIDLDVPTGQRLALVGPSGAGKSTIAALIAAIHEPDSGSVQVTGPIALLSQEGHTFLGSIAENLLLVAPDADGSALRAALESIGAWEWVAALPGGLDTSIGSAGYRLTPAQHQQIGLARLVLADPAVVVLDEATADFDPSGAREVERSLDAALRGRTVIAIVHRLHAAQHADQIAVIDNGRLTEAGSHDDLLAARGDYFALWQRWTHHHVSISPSVPTGPFDGARR